MPANDPFAALLREPRVAEALADSSAAIAALHRRPAALRRHEVLASESALRGARSGLILDGHAYRHADMSMDVENSPELGRAISAAAVLAPGQQEQSVRTFKRAPLQIFAALDVAAGGEGAPSEGGAERVAALGRLVRASDSALLPAVIHAEVVARELFGERSGLVGRVASRLAAIAVGFDPRGLAVPEPYLVRHRAEYHAALAAYAAEPHALLELILRAWEAGAAEGEGIVRALG